MRGTATLTEVIIVGLETAVIDELTMTVIDAEGRQISTPVKKEIQEAKVGINYNYEGDDILTSQQAADEGNVDSSLWYIIFGLPPALYFLMFAAIRLQHQRRKDPGRRKARKAYATLKSILKSLKADTSIESAKRCQLIGNSLKDYLGAKLQLNPAAITYADIEPVLQGHGVIPRLERRHSETEPAPVEREQVSRRGEIAQ